MIINSYATILAPYGSCLNYKEFLSDTQKLLTDLECFSMIVSSFWRKSNWIKNIPKTKMLSFISKILKIFGFICLIFKRIFVRNNTKYKLY